MRKRKLTAEQYRDRYCQERCMRSRTQLYVSQEMRNAVMETVRLFKKSHVTAVSLVDAILREHFNLHREMIEGERERDYQELKEFLGIEDSNDDITVEED